MADNGVMNLPPGYTLEEPQQQTPTLSKPTQGGVMNLPEGYTLEDPQTGNVGTGQLTNDVGNTVIVPKDGESFADTMHRAAAYGKTVTPSQVNAELATAPKKAATVLAAAPVIGAAGAASLAAPGEAISGGGRLIQISEAALHEYAEAHPLLVKLAAHLGIESTKAFGLYKLMKSVAGNEK